MSRLTLVIVSIAAGVVLAVGATFATSAVVSSTQSPSNQPPYSYGG